MIFDHRNHEFHLFRNKLAVVAAPIQFVVNAPIKAVHWLSMSVASKNHLLEQNAKLRAHELLLQSKLQKLLVLERENVQLRQLLKSTSQLGGRVKVSQLLAVDLDPSLRQIVIDRGLSDGVYVGQPVLDAYGIMGQVIDVGVLTSKVLLITDRHFAIPVKDHRNGIRAIAIGLGQSGELALINVPDTTDVKKGDLFVSSGLGLRFPVGYPVGVVSKLQRLPGRRFATIILIPSAHLNQTQQVLLAWPNHAALTKAVQKELAKKVSGVKK